MNSIRSSLQLAVTLVVTLCWTSAPSAMAQKGSQHALSLTWNHRGIDAENQDDPAYGLYRKGYALVLEEHWQPAIEQFEQLQQRYPRSTYSDDAAYWSAYALKHLRPRAAAEAYHAFLEQHRESRYLDDAVADLEEIEASLVVIPPSVGVPAPAVDGALVIAPSLQRLERELRKASRAYRRRGVPMVFRVEETLDPTTRLRMEALYAIGETTKDEQAFRTLRQIAVARGEPLPLREAALEALVSFPHDEALPVFLHIAREDTSTVIQAYAVDLIAEAPVDTSKRVALLIDLYRTLPPTRREQRQTIFYSIADFGTEPAIDFLGDVALNSQDYEIRRDAVYYLGSIGGPTARSLLMKILLEK